MHSQFQSHFILGAHRKLTLPFGNLYVVKTFGLVKHGITFSQPTTTSRDSVIFMPFTRVESSFSKSCVVLVAQDKSLVKHRPKTVSYKSHLSTTALLKLIKKRQLFCKTNTFSSLSSFHYGL